MVFIPEISDYKPFYIQTSVDTGAIDTTVWGLVAKVNPFPALPNPKEPYKNEWHDQNGDDEYTEQMFYEPIEFSVAFYVKTYATDAKSAEAVMLSQIDSFFAKIRQGEFMIYDSYTGIGRKKVRYAGYDEEEFKRRHKSGAGWARAIFTIKFKVNDPITRISLVNGKLVEE
jgi:hypothetical protein